MRGSRGYHTLGRRDLVVGAATALLSSCRQSPSITSPSTGLGPSSSGAAGAPEPRWGVQSGDVGSSRAMIWCRSDRPSRMLVEWSTSPTFTSPRRVPGPAATEEGDLIAKVALEGLPSSTRIHYRVRFEAEGASDWLTGALSTPDALDDTAKGSSPSDVVFAWSGDTNGQGWGIDPARGGMPAYTALLDRAPDFFISCGDTIYADHPIPPELALPGGGTWKNLVTPAKSHIAETLEDFRGAHLYPRLSREVRALSAAVPSFDIWDDHEVRNNWFPGEHELAHLFLSLRARGVQNVVWLTADVHYAAAHRYAPSRSGLRDMDPFWEFVAGPMHASSFPRKRFDDTFGPELVYASAGWDTFGSPATGARPVHGVTWIGNPHRSAGRRRRRGVIRRRATSGFGGDFSLLALRPRKCDVGTGAAKVGRCRTQPWRSTPSCRRRPNRFSPSSRRCPRRAGMRWARRSSRAS